MRTIYIDSEYRCHVKSADALKAVETDFFDGKCDAYVEGYRFVPQGNVWVREDGLAFTGEMVTPWKDHDGLMAAQAEYEKAQAATAEMEAALDYLFGGDTA